MARRDEPRSSKATSLPAVEPETCKTCRFAVDDKGILVCRRFPPHIAGERIPVRDDYWCGEHQKRT